MRSLRNLQRMNGSSSKDLVVVCSVFIFSTCALLDAYLCFFVTSHPPGPHGVTLPIERNHSCFQPFCIINAKGLLLDPANFYIHTPLSDILVSKLRLEGRDYTDFFFKANFISFSHLPVALLAAKFISKESLFHRRLGVFLFEARNFLDCFDGSLARVGMRQLKKMAETEEFRGKKLDLEHNFGFWIDGICDAVGCVFLYIACIWYLRKHPPKRSLVSYSPLPVVTPSNIKSQKDGTDGSESGDVMSCQMETSVMRIYFLKLRQLVRSIQLSGGFYAILFGFQTGLGSAMWNRYIVTYTKILESPEGSPFAKDPWVTSIRSGLLHSPMMWVVCYAWRYVNPHSFVEVLLIAIFFDKIHEVLNALKWAGFLILITVICFTEVHLYECKQLLQNYVSF